MTVLLTVPEAREVLRARVALERGEERADPPAWAPFTAMHPAREISAARAAAATRVEHALALAELPDGVLRRLLADGWTPLPGYADNRRYVRSLSEPAGRGLPPCPG